MIIAQQKRKENIAEYILYMWQVEDTIRACRFDIGLIEKRIISQYSEGEKVQQAARDWYANLIVIMHEENLQSGGHMKMLQGIVDEMYNIHKRIIETQRDPKYLELYQFAVPNIRDFEQKLGRKPVNDIDTCLTGLYALLLLRLQKKEISRGTLKAMQSFSNLLALLAKWFRKIEEGTAEL